MLKTINEDFIQARKSQDKVRAGVLSMVLTDVQNLTKTPGRNGAAVTDDEVQNIVKGWVKKTNDAISLTQKGNGDTTKMEAEREILSAYLPRQMTEDELKVAIEGLLNEGVAKSVGPIMGALKARYGNQYDGRMASIVVKTFVI